MIDAIPITYRVAVQPNEGRKASTLQTLVPALTALAGDERLAKHSGFSLHAGVAAAARQCKKVGRLRRRKLALGAGANG